MRNIPLILLSLTALSLTSTPSTAAVVSKLQIKCKANRTSGVVPFAMTLDCSDTKVPGWSKSKVFSSLKFYADFGDHSVTAMERMGHGSLRPVKAMRDINAISNFVYETPGEYTVKIWVRKSKNEGWSRPYSFIVTAFNPYHPKQGIPVSKSACISQDGSFAKCPAGFKRIQLSGLETISKEVNLAGTGSSVRDVRAFGEQVTQLLRSGYRRLHFQAGKKWFTQTPVIISNMNRVRLDTYGDYRRLGLPTIHFNSHPDTVVKKSIFESIVTVDNASDVSITRLKITAHDDHPKGKPNGFEVRGNSPNALLLQNQIDRVHLGVKSMEPTRMLYLAVVGNLITNIGALRNGGNQSGGNGFHFSGYGLAVANNRVENTTRGEHGMRIQGAKYSVFSSNTILNPDRIRHALTLRGFEDVTKASEFNVIENNKLSSDHAWTVFVGQSNCDGITAKQVVQDTLLVQNDVTSKEGATNVAINFSGRRSMILGNLVRTPAMGAGIAVTANCGVQGIAPENVSLIGNQVAPIQ